MVKQFVHAFVVLVPQQFQVSGITDEEAAKRRILRAGYPDDTLEHPKRVSEIPTNPGLYGKDDWNASTQVPVADVVVATVKSSDLLKSQSWFVGDWGIGVLGYCRRSCRCWCW